MALLLQRRGVRATPRQIDYWTRSGYLHPENPEPGSGTERKFSLEETEVASRMARLVAAGFVPAAAAEHARLGVGCHEIGPGVFLEISPGVA